MSRPVHIAPPCHQAIGILHVDEDLLLIDKPAGLLSVPGRHPANRDSVALRLEQDYPGARIVHRLDMATSGVMVVARNADSHRALSRQFEQRAVSKCYQAIVWGRLRAEQGLIELPLICDWPNRPLQKVDLSAGKRAVTRYRVLEYLHKPERCRLELRPVTGRSHQLRVHAASLGHPIAGCEFYAHPAARALAPRLLLHACELQFHHPRSGKPMTGASPAPF